jgi:hypothetical protein
MSFDDTKCEIEAWRTHDNDNLPRSALDWRALGEFASQRGFKPVLQSNKEVDPIPMNRIA